MSRPIPPRVFPANPCRRMAAVWLLAATTAFAVSPDPGELATAGQWLAARFSTGASASVTPPGFSFTYEGRPSADLLPHWTQARSTRALDPQRTEDTLTYTDPATGLVVRWVGVTYQDFPTVEWTVHFKNTGTRDTPILAHIQAIDAGFVRPADGEFELHYNRGDFRSAESYSPQTETLGLGVVRHFAPTGGKSTNGQFPYWNVGWPGGGVVVAVGWPGQWSARFVRDKEATLRVCAGQELTHLTLHPGEEIRTPLVVLQFYAGDEVRAQNIWRRWMRAHNTPRPGGQPPAPMLNFCSGGFFPGLKVSAASERQFIDVLTRERIQLDYWWMDAGWYPCADWFQTGTWEADPGRFPRGIREVSDYLHARKTKLIVWFEPERAAPNTWLTLNRPQWILGGAKGGVVNLGNPEAWDWIVDRFDRIIREEGIDLYRQDFNIDPLASWRANDADDRQGLTENKHVCAYLALWDELQRRHPGLLIDSCAGGGRRNDLETLRRSVPLLRSDYQSFTGEPVYLPGNQGQTYGLSSWIPFYGSGIYYSPERLVENMRSSLSPSFSICTDVRTGGTDWDLYRKLAGQWRQVAGCMLGDFYPLTPHRLGAGDWIAWQFDRPEEGDGMIQAFRREKNGSSVLQPKLRGLDPAAVYRVTDLDTATTQEIPGRELLDRGLAVVIKDQPGSALIYYRKKP